MFDTVESSEIKSRLSYKTLILSKSTIINVLSIFALYNEDIIGYLTYIENSKD